MGKLDGYELSGKSFEDSLIYRNDTASRCIALSVASLFDIEPRFLGGWVDLRKRTFLASASLQMQRRARYSLRRTNRCFLTPFGGEEGVSLSTGGSVGSSTLPRVLIPNLHGVRKCSPIEQTHIVCSANLVRRLALSGTLS
jgi:hypothetical protein